MKVEMRRVNSIKVVDRVRDTVGDLRELKDSMRGRGLINPITIEADGTLIAGERRLTAARELRWAEIPCHVWQDEAADELIAIEIEENTCRTPLTLTEAERAWQRYRELLRPLIKDGRPPEKDLGTMDTFNQPRGKLNELAAQSTGYGRPTMERVEEIRETAEDETVPEPVRQVAQEELGKLSKSTRGAAPALEKVRQSKRQATREAASPGQWLKSDEPQVQPKAVTWHTRLWGVVGTGKEIRKTAEELELDPDTSSLSGDDIDRMMKLLQEQVVERQDLRKVLRSIKEGRKATQNGRQE